jgi:hypothetical protein
MLSVPAGLNRREFEVWVSTQMLASPFVESVMQATNVEDRVLWTQLAEIWNIPHREAARSIETARSWVNAFLKSKFIGYRG